MCRGVLIARHGHGIILVTLDGGGDFRVLGLIRNYAKKSIMVPLWSSHNEPEHRRFFAFPKAGTGFTRWNSAALI
jgi:hypothetical protein